VFIKIFAFLFLAMFVSNIYRKMVIARQWLWMPLDLSGGSTLQWGAGRILQMFLKKMTVCTESSRNMRLVVVKYCRPI